MGHVAEDTLLAYLDGELPQGERAAVSAHLAECETCAAALAGLRAAAGRLSQALRRIDRPAPVRDPYMLPQARILRRSWIPARRALVKAAVLVLAAAGAAAAAVPGSPVRAWLVRPFSAVAALFRPEPAAPEPSSTQGEGGRSAALAISGVAVPLEGGAVLIGLTNPDPEAIVRVRIVEGDRAAAFSEQARYRTGLGRIEVVGAGPGELRIEIPAAARAARVEIDGRPVVLKEGSNLRLLTPAVDSAGAEVSFRAGRE